MDPSLCSGHLVHNRDNDQFPLDNINLSTLLDYIHLHKLKRPPVTCRDISKIFPNSKAFFSTFSTKVLQIAYEDGDVKNQRVFREEDTPLVHHLHVHPPRGICFKYQTWRVVSKPRLAEHLVLGTMYIGVLPQWPQYLAITTGMEGDFWDMIGKVCETLWQFIFRGFLLAEAWIVKFIPSLTLTVETIHNAYTFVQTYPYPFHTIAWSIFFGPIAILIPSLLALELTILFLFYAGFLCHGFRLGSLEDRFQSLREYFMDTRESLFSVVESWSSVFNTWTSRYPPLLVFRLLSASLGIFTLVGIWTNWHFGIS